MAKTILIIDDPRLWRMLLRRVMSNSDHTIIKVADETAGLQVAEQEQPNLIFSCLLMPELNGFEFLEQRRAHDWTVPVVVLTADIHAQIRSDLLELNVQDVLYKTIDTTAVNQSIVNIRGNN